jgi:hypothetical protein
VKKNIYPERLMEPTLLGNNKPKGKIYLVSIYTSLSLPPEFEIKGW